MPLGLGWENPDPDASSGIGGDDEATAAQQASAQAAPESAPAKTTSSPTRNSSGKKSSGGSGTRSDGRKTSTTKGGSSKQRKKSAKSEKSSSAGKSKPAESATSGITDRPELAAAAATAAAMGGPEAAEDDAPSPHKSSSRRHKSSRSGSSQRHRSSGERSRSNTKQQPASSTSSSRRTKSGTRTSSGKPGRPSGSPRASPRSSPRASPNRDRNSTNHNNTSMDSAVAAVAAAAAAGGSDGLVGSPTESNETRETSYDSWRENGSNEDVDDIEAGGASSPRSSSSPAKRSYKDKSSSGRGSSGGRGSRSKSAGKSGSRSKSSGSGKKGSDSRHHSQSGRSSRNSRNHRSSSSRGRSSSRRHTSHSRRKYDYVSCCGWEWKKTHLLFLAVALILLAGGAVAALLFTGILGTGGRSSQASDFSSITTSPTAAPTNDDFALSIGDGNRPTPRPTMRNNGGSPATSDQSQPAPAPRPTGTPMPTSCTETTDLFKYFDDLGAVITTNCKKVALSTESNDVKCQRTVVFGGGYSVRDMCPITCGGCLFKQGNVENDGPMPTDKPTAFTLEPTPVPKPVAVPTLATPTSNGGSIPIGEFDGHDTFSFYVMGDIPYMYKQDLTLIEQLRDQTDTLDPKEEIFQVHVGDIQNPKKTQCVSSHFDKIAGYFKTYSKLPSLILPGDNDWNDCPNPDLAWQYWQSNFVPFEQYWSDTSDFPSTVMRQSGQRENFAFQRGGVLFLGVNLVGGQTNEYVTEEDWDRKVDNDIAWAQFHMDRLNVGSPKADPMDEDYIRAVIIFGHSPRGRRFNNFLMQRLYNSNLPVVYFHGNGHTYEAVQPFLSDGWTNYWRIQVDQGFNAPPAKVTVRGTTPEALRTSMSINGGKIFPGGFIKLDRRGGLYEGAVATDADGNPLISGVGG